MKTNFLAAAIIAAAIFLSSCGKDGLCIKGSGPIQSENRVLDPFTRIKLEGSADVYVTRDSIQSVVVEAQGNVLEVYETEVTGNQLCLGFQDKCIKNHEPIKVFISVPDVEELKISGSGSIFGSDLVSDYKLTCFIEGSGNIELQNVQVNELQSRISGSGNITSQGAVTIQKHTVTVEGSGNIKAFDLPANSVDVSILGSGNCKVHAVQELDVNIEGSGNVYYTGNPAISTHIAGSGNLINAN